MPNKYSAHPLQSLTLTPKPWLRLDRDRYLQNKFTKESAKYKNAFFYSILCFVEAWDFFVELQLHS